MKRFLSILLSILMISTLFIGCSKKDGEDDTPSSTPVESTEDDQSSDDQDDQNHEEEPEASGDAVDVRLTLWGDFTEADVETQLVNEFNEKNDDVNIVFEPIPGDAYGEKLMANFAAGTACDLFLIGEGDYMMYYDQGVTTNLNDYYKESETFDLGAYNEGLINMGIFNDELHYLPKDFNPIALYYNKDLFDKYSVEYPTDEWTWDDLEEAASKLTHKDEDEFGFFADSWGYAVMIYLRSMGTDIGNEEADKAEGFINSPETVDAITRYTNYVLKDGYSPSSAAVDDFGGATSMFQTGKIGMMVSDGWNIKTLDDAGINYGTALIPKGPEGERGEIICAASWAIYSKSENKDAAWKALEFMTGPDAHARRSQENAGILPAFDDQLEAKKESSPQAAGLIEMMDYAYKPVRVRSITGQYYDKGFGEAMEEILLNGKDVKAALDDAAKIIDEAIEDHE